MEHVVNEERIATKEKVTEEGLGVFSTLTEKQATVELQHLSAGDVNLKVKVGKNFEM